MNLVKNFKIPKLTKINQKFPVWTWSISKLDEKLIKNPSLGSGPALNLNAYQKQVKDQGRSLNWDHKSANSKKKVSLKSELRI